MTRIEEPNGHIHYRNPARPEFCLCGHAALTYDKDLFGKANTFPYAETDKKVNCPGCAKVICACRNEVYNTLVANIEDETLNRGIFAAVGEDGAPC